MAAACTPRFRSTGNRQDEQAARSFLGSAVAYTYVLRKTAVRRRPTDLCIGELAIIWRWADFSLALHVGTFVLTPHNKFFCDSSFFLFIV